MISPFDLYIKMYNGKLPTELDPDYLELLRMSKYRIEDVPTAQPGKCGNCGSSKNDGRQYISFGQFIDFYGEITLCGLCLQNMASEMGLFNKFQREIAQLHLKVSNRVHLETTAVNLEKVILHTFEEVKDYFDNLRSASDDSSSDSSTLSDSNETESDQLGTVGTEQGIVKAESGAVQSSASGGSENVSELAKLINSNS